MKQMKSRVLMPVLAVSAIAMSAYALTVEPPPQPEQATQAVAPRGPAADTETVRDARLVTLESEEFRATLTSQNTALTQYVLKDERYQRDGKPIDLVTTDKPAYLPLRFSISGVELPRGQSWEVLESTPNTARFRLRAGDVELFRKIEVGQGPYQLWSTLRVENHGKVARKLAIRFEGHHYVRREQEKGGFMAGRSPLSAGGMCMQDGTPERAEREEIVDEKPSFQGKVAFGTVDNVYFTQATAAHGREFDSCRLAGSDRGGSPDSPDGSLLSLQLGYTGLNLPPSGEVTVRTLSYVGPKLPDTLAKAGHGLNRASYMGGVPGIDAIAQGLVGMLSLIYRNVVSNWGIAIILLTIFVKLVLYPLTAKSFQSIAAMRRLKPEIDLINEKFANDREKKGAAMMELYRKHKINPFGGCLPQLLQLPVWWALYMSLSSNVELFRRPFVWPWVDLTAPDPFYALPLALGLLMWVQQKITPSTMDPAQAKMMLYLMPAMITAFMLFLPSGLCLYMLTNSALSIGQQRFIEYRLAEKKIDAAGTAAGGASGSPSNAGKDAASPGRTGRGRA